MNPSVDIGYSVITTRIKAQFKKSLKAFAETLDVGVSATDRQWAVIMKMFG